MNYGLKDCGERKKNMKNIEGKSFLISGATGLIGKSMTKYIADNGGEIIAVVRDMKKAEKMFEQYNNIQYICSDINTLPVKKMNIDYIIHAANQTSSCSFVEEPVETIMTAINGTRNTLEIAKLSNVKGYIYLSSMEVYGAPTKDEKIVEDHDNNINTMTVRSCYPESKRLCEAMCASYFSEYNVPINVVRLTQTFGEGVNYNDGRVFAEFARAAIEKKNIILNTKGETRRNYLYVGDAVSAIIRVLFNGKRGEAYNVANEKTYCSIYEMALLVSKECANNQIQVLINEDAVKSKNYAPTLHMNLDTSKIKQIGWSPKVGLKEMYSRMIADMICQK